jgi:hypothetical protein
MGGCCSRSKVGDEDELMVEFNPTTRKNIMLQEIPVTKSAKSTLNTSQRIIVAQRDENTYLNTRTVAPQAFRTDSPVPTDSLKKNKPSPIFLNGESIVTSTSNEPSKAPPPSPTNGAQKSLPKSPSSGSRGRIMLEPLSLNERKGSVAYHTQKQQLSG